MTRSRFAALLLAAPVLFLACERTPDLVESRIDVGGTTKGGPTAPAANPAITFVGKKLVGKGSGAAEHRTIAVINADGSAQTHLYTAATSTSPNLESANPTWSPDGQSISFVEAANGVHSIRVLDVTVSNGVATGTLRSGAVATVSGTNTDRCYTQEWSPSTAASEIAYVHTSGTGTGVTSTIRVATIGGSNVSVHSSASGWFIESIAWSPDASEIAFVERQDGDAGMVEGRIRVIDRDGTNLRTLATKTSGNFHWGLDWSRGGDRIAYSWNPGTGATLYTLGVSSLTETALAAGGLAPAWSPDDAKLAYYGPTGMIKALTLSSGTSTTLLTYATGAAPKFPNWRR